MLALLLAFMLGTVAGLRTFTAPAAVLIARGSVAGFVLAIAALGEYVADLMPATPARTHILGVAVRLISGAISGYLLAGGLGAFGVPGAIAGAAGSLLGTYGGYALRLKLIARIGAIPAGLSEDAIAVAAAVAVVTFRA